MMRWVPEEVCPSNLLWTDNLSPSAQELQEICQRFCGAQDPSHLEIWKGNARELLYPNKPNDYAIILICLADLYLTIHRPAPALKASREANEHLCPWPDSRHRHNIAVSLYAIGLAHQFMGNDIQALQYYDRAIAKFGEVQELWRREHNVDMDERCDIAMRWLKGLRGQLGYARTHGRPASRIPLLVLSRVAAGDPLLIGEDFERWEEVDVRHANGANFLLEVKGDSMIEADIYDGDLVLIEQRSDWPTDGHIVVVRIERMDPEAVIKRFYRAANHIRLEPANDDHPIIVITPDGTLDPSTRDYYIRRHPNGLEPQVCSESEVQVVGWYRGKIET